VTSSSGAEVCKRYRVARTILTTNKDRFKNLLLNYAERILAFLRIDRQVLRQTDIIISVSDHMPDILPALILSIANPRAKWCACVYHLTRLKFDIPSILNFLFQRIALLIISKLADMVITEQDVMKGFLASKLRIDPKKIIVCSGGVDTECADAAPWNGQKRFSACFIGTLDRRKGIFDLLNAWKIVCQRERSAKLAIVGGGNPMTWANLIRLVKRLGLQENVTFLGFLDEISKFSVLKSSKAFVLPSYEEGIPIVFYEAMYIGLPVITYWLPSYAGLQDYLEAAPLGAIDFLATILMRASQEPLARAEDAVKFAKQHNWDNFSRCMIQGLLSRLERPSRT